MSQTTRYWLLASTFVSIFIAFIIWMWTKYKIKKLKSKYRTEEAKKYDHILKKNVIEERGETLGELLWDLKDKTKNPLHDVDLEYILNSAIRNGFNTFKIIPDDNYIEQSLIKIAKIKKSDNSKELIIIKNSSNLNDQFDEEYKKLNKGGMIFIIEAPKRGQVKKLLSYTKMSGIRREYAKLGKGMVIVAK